MCVCHSGKESSDLGSLVPVFEWKLHGVFTSFLFGDAATGVSKKNKLRSATQRWWSLQRMALPKERRSQNRRSKKRSNPLIVLPLRMLQFCRTTQDEIRCDILPKSRFYVGFLSIQNLSLLTGFLVSAQMSLVKRNAMKIPQER